MNSSRENFLMLFFGVCAGVAVAIAAYVFEPHFQSVYEGFGAELPLPTQLLLATFRWWGLVPAMTIALWACWPNPSKRGAIALIFGSVSAVGLAIFGGLAAYAPIFMLGASQS